MVQAIPEGVNSIVPYLCIRGAKKAIEFYKAAFGAEVISVMPMGDDLVGHADLRIAGSHVYLSDEMPGSGAVQSPRSLKGTSATIHLWVADCDATFAQAVAAGAKVVMPLADQFWGDRYGTVSDPFGHAWAITTHKEDLTPEEMKRRGEAAMAQMAAAKPAPAAPKPKPRPKPKKGLPPGLKPKAPAKTEPKPAEPKPAEPKASVASKAESAPKLPEAKGAKKLKKAKKDKKDKKAKKAKKSKPEKKSKRDKKRKKKSKR